MSMIRFEGVSKAYNDHAALSRVNFVIEPGEFVSIVGQSGAGKTTLIKLLTAEESPTEGRIVVGDWDITRIRSSEIAPLRRQMGMIFQDYKLLPKKTLFENVAFALEVVGASGALIREIVPQVLAIVGLERRQHVYPSTLSGGEQQRVAVARALVHRPKILLADEPTGNLDAHHTEEIIDLLKRINAFGTTVLLVTHNRDVVNRLRKRVMTLKDGKLVSDHAHGRYQLAV